MSIPQCSAGHFSVPQQGYMGSMAPPPLFVSPSVPSSQVQPLWQAPVQPAQAVTSPSSLAQALQGLPLVQQHSFAAQAVPQGHYLPFGSAVRGSSGASVAPGVPDQVVFGQVPGFSPFLASAVMDRLNASHEASTRVQAHLAVSRVPPGHLVFRADPDGLYIEDFFNRLEAFHTPVTTDMEKVNMCLSRLEPNPILLNVVSVGWSGTYASLRSWLIDTFEGIGVRRDVRQWTKAARYSNQDFRQWQGDNVRLIDDTIRLWPTWHLDTKILIMALFQDMLPPASLRIVKVPGSREFDSRKLLTIPFIDILADLQGQSDDHSEKWRRHQASLPKPPRGAGLRGSHAEPQNAEEYAGQQGGDPASTSQGVSQEKRGSPRRFKGGRKGKHRRSKGDVSSDHDRGDAKDSSKAYCTHHRVYGHDNKDCWALQQSKGHNTRQDTRSGGDNRASGGRGHYRRRGRGRHSVHQGSQGRQYDSGKANYSVGCLQLPPPLLGPVTWVPVGAASAVHPQHAPLANVVSPLVPPASSVQQIAHPAPPSGNELAQGLALGQM